MKRTWILVANRSHARLFMGCEDNNAVAELDAFANPGAAQMPCPRHAPGAVHPEAEAKFARRFALTLDAVLDQGRIERRYDRLLLAAPTPFLDVLRDSLSTPVRRKLVGEYDSDLIALTPPEIAARLCPRLKAIA